MYNGLNQCLGRPYFSAPSLMHQQRRQHALCRYGTTWIRPVVTGEENLYFLQVEHDRLTDECSTHLQLG